MPKTKCVAVFLSLGLAAFVLPNSSWAQDDDDKKRGKHEQHDKRDKDDDYKKNKHNKKSQSRDHFIDDDHRAIRHYYSQHPHGMPPGLAKRGKMPHGLSRGQVVTTEYHSNLLPLPPKLELQLPPPPHEVMRRILGRDILMIDKQTHKVLDILRDAVPH